MRYHDGDRLADIPDLVDSERQLQEILEPGHRRDSRADRLQGRPEVGMGEDADHARHGSGGGHVDASNAPMRPRTAEDGCVQHSVEVNVVDVPAGTGQQPRVLTPRNRLADMCRHDGFR